MGWGRIGSAKGLGGQDGGYRSMQDGWEGCNKMKRRPKYGGIINRHARQIDDGQAFRHRGSLVGGGAGGSRVDMDCLITERTKADVKGQGEGV